jgi:hypothetical protein
MRLQQTEQRLLDLVLERREEECRKLKQRAEEEARELLRNAYRSALNQLRENVESERERVRVRVGAARAELETLRRQHAQQLGSVVLKAVWERLPRLLADRWADHQKRAAWIAGTLEQAQARLPRGLWRIRHPADLEEDECSALHRAVQERVGQAPRLVADGSLETGLVVDCGGVMLDASIAGLLADPDAIEARLLALIDLEQMS